MRSAGEVPVLEIGSNVAFVELSSELVAILLLLNVAFVVAVYGRRFHGAIQEERADRVRGELGPVVASLGADASAEDRARLLHAVRRLDRRSRPVAAALLLDRLADANEVDRAAVRELLRDSGAIGVALHSTEARQAWRRALACAALGAAREVDAVPVLLRRLEDRNRHVREAAVEALGLVGDPAAVPALRELFLTETQVRPGIVYAALVRLGSVSSPVFETGMTAASAAVRAAACAGLAQTVPGRATPALVLALGDDDEAVRAAAAQALGTIGGAEAPDALLAAAADGADAVRAAAVWALASYDDPRAVEAASVAVGDGRREIAQRAGETLLLLSRKPAAGPLAAAQVETNPSWTVESARVLARIGAL